MGKLLEELKRRKVFRVAAVYAVVAWVLIQVADTVLPALQMPQWTVSFVTILFILGFPIAVILAWAYETTSEGVVADAGIPAPQYSSPNPNDRYLIYTILALVLLVAGFQLSDRFLTDNDNLVSLSTELSSLEDSPAAIRTSINLNTPLTRSGSGARTKISISPDGSALAYTDFFRNRIWQRDLVTQARKEVLSSAGYNSFSPDGQNLLVYTASSGNNRIIPTLGGTPQPLSIESGPPAGWLSDEDIIYRGSAADVRIFSLIDGTDVVVPNIDGAGTGGLFHGLPGGTAFFFTKNLPPSNQWDIRVYDLETESSTHLVSEGYHPQYVNSGHVLFIRRGNLWAIPFDLDSLSVTGAEARVLEGIDSTQALVMGAYSVSDLGRLVYLPGREYIQDQSVLYWSDRQGNREEIGLPAGSYSEPRLSPDEESLAMTSYKNDGSSDIWIYNFSSDIFSPLTFSGNARNPVWTPDGSQLVYQMTPDGQLRAPRGELWIVNANGTGQAELILDAEAKADSFSAIDGKLMYMTGGADTGTPINVSTLTYIDNAWISAPLLDLPYSTYGARVSPDGRWIAYGSNESGINQIYVQPYPNLDGGKWQISTHEEIPSREPSWGPNGQELFFLRLDGSIMQTEVTAEGESFSTGRVQPLISELIINTQTTPNYVASNSGEQFLHFYNEENKRDTGLQEEYTELVVVENFFEELKRLAPSYPQ